MRIAQISDTHISSDFPGRSADLKRCVSQINTLDPLPDIVVHTGDIVHDGLPEQYDIARSLLSALKVPWFVMAGNKDNRQALTSTFSKEHRPRPDFPFVQYAVDGFPIRLVCVDTLCEESNKGELCKDRLDDMDQLLNAEPNKPTAVFMHHPPFDVSVAPDPFQFIDRQSADDALDIIARHRSVCGLICGHVHRPFTTEIGPLPVRVMTAVALDLRFGEKEPPAPDAPLYKVHAFDPSKPALVTAG